MPYQWYEVERNRAQLNLVITLSNVCQKFTSSPSKEICILFSFRRAPRQVLKPCKISFAEDFPKKIRAIKLRCNNILLKVPITNM